jgi:hypothetical protein
MTSVWLSPQYFAPRVDLHRVDPAKGLDPAWFPGLCALSSAFIWDFAFRSTEQRTPEFVRVPFRKRSTAPDISPEDMTVYSWNMTWEIGHLRQKLFKLNLPTGLAWVSKFPDSNLYLLPDTNPYEAYLPLYHLLPARSVKTFSLPVFGKGLWPMGLGYPDGWFTDLHNDFREQLSQAFARHLWPLLNSRSPASAFSQDDPIIVLSHNLDFWLPYAYRIIEDRLRAFPRCDSAGPAQIAALKRLRAAIPPGMEVDLPLKGGDIWCGEADAWQAAQELVAAADRQGKLRAIIDAVRSHRIEDDFSGRWSHEREDFERKLYHKRLKYKVSFVQLDDTVPVHGPSSEVEEDRLWSDFLALLNPKERRIVVCLRNGTTKASEISRILGYANHSPVSKALKHIRAKARQYLET